MLLDALFYELAPFLELTQGLKYAVAMLLTHLPESPLTD